VRVRVSVVRRRDAFVVWLRVVVVSNIWVSSARVRRALCTRVMYGMMDKAAPSFLILDLTLATGTVGVGVVGACVGCNVGAWVGVCVGCNVGACVGVYVGWSVGVCVGVCVGWSVGDEVGDTDGAVEVGDVEGPSVGWSDGD
jgi:hypothetical protein